MYTPYAVVYLDRVLSNYPLALPPLTTFPPETGDSLWYTVASLLLPDEKTLDETQRNGPIGYHRRGRNTAGLCARNRALLICFSNPTTYTY